jgi:hypothetical protein
MIWVRNPTDVSFIIKYLLRKNHALGELASVIEAAWLSLLEVDETNQSIYDEGYVGWIPYPNHNLYQLIAEDLETFLKSDLDPLESLDLLAHLISFHLTLYIYHLSQSNVVENHLNSSGLQKCRPILLVDLLEGKGKEGEVIRKESAKLFKEQEHRQEQIVINYIQTKLDSWAEELKFDGESFEELACIAKKHFNIAQAGKKTRQDYDERIHKIIHRFSARQISYSESIQNLQEVLAQFLLKDFRKNFLPVHRKLAKRSGFVAPLTGPGARFVFGDNLLKAILIATVPPGNQIPFGDFLGLLFSRYGIVIGPEEARKSSLFDRQRINAEYYDYNRNALLEKMKHAGLVAEYSDATALVVNSEVAVGEEVNNV